MRFVLCAFACVALVACGGLLSDDEKVSTTTFGTPVPPDGGASVPTPSTPDAGTPEVDIATLPGLVLWLDAERGITLDGSSTVTRWADQSIEHNDVTLHEGGGAHGNGTLGAGGNGNAVQFDGTTTYAATPSAALASWAGDFYVAAVVHPNVDSGFDEGIFGCYGAQPSVPGHTLAQFYVSSDHQAWTDIESDGWADSAKTAALASAPYVLSFRRSGAQLEARRNGAVDKTETVPHVTTPTCTQIFVGALPSDGTSQTDAHFTGSIAELVVVHGALSSDIADGVESQLMAKYLLAH